VICKVGDKEQQTTVGIGGCAGWQQKRTPGTWPKQQQLQRKDTALSWQQHAHGIQIGVQAAAAHTLPPTHHHPVQAHQLLTNYKPPAAVAPCPILLLAACCRLRPGPHLGGDL
jgi:hypothetical protein